MFEIKITLMVVLHEIPLFLNYFCCYITCYNSSNDIDINLHHIYQNYTLNILKIGILVYTISSEGNPNQIVFSPVEEKIRP